MQPHYCRRETDLRSYYLVRNCHTISIVEVTRYKKELTPKTRDIFSKSFSLRWGSTLVADVLLRIDKNVLNS